MADLEKPVAPPEVRGSLDGLLRRAAGGDRAAEEAAFEDLRDRFYVLARPLMSDDDARDVAQEACLTVLHGYRDLRSPYRYRAYAHKVFRSRVADYFNARKARRRHMVETDAPDELPSPAAAMEEPQLLLSLARCLQRLRAKHPRYARAVNLVHLGYDTDQITHRMGISRNHLYVLLNRGRNLLRRCLDHEEGA